MITPISIVFPNEAGAQQGLLALKALQAEGSLALYGSAILVKDASGKLSLRSVDEGPFGLIAGAVVGGLVGLPVGPVTAALSAAGGATLGALHENHQELDRSSFLQRAAGQVPPGWSAVVAEMAEFGQSRLETRMQALGGLVLSHARAEVEYQAAIHQLDEIRSTSAAAWVEYEAALAKAAAAREAHLAEARTRLAESEPRLTLLGAHMQAQTEAHVAQLRQLAEQAGPDRCAELEYQIARTRGDHYQRCARLEEAWKLAESTLAH